MANNNSPAQTGEESDYDYNAHFLRGQMLLQTAVKIIKIFASPSYTAYDWPLPSEPDVDPTEAETTYSLNVLGLAHAAVRLKPFFFSPPSSLLSVLLARSEAGPSPTRSFTPTTPSPPPLLALLPATAAPSPTRKASASSPSATKGGHRLRASCAT